MVTKTFLAEELWHALHYTRMDTVWLDLSFFDVFSFWRLCVGFSTSIVVPPNPAVPTLRQAIRDIFEGRRDAYLDALGVSQKIISGYSLSMLTAPSSAAPSTVRPLAGPIGRPSTWALPTPCLTTAPSGTPTARATTTPLGCPGVSPSGGPLRRPCRGAERAPLQIPLRRLLWDAQRAPFGQSVHPSVHRTPHPVSAPAPRREPHVPGRPHVPRYWRCAQHAGVACGALTLLGFDDGEVAEIFA